MAIPCNEGRKAIEFRETLAAPEGPHAESAATLTWILFKEELCYCLPAPAYIRLQHSFGLKTPRYCEDGHERFDMLFRKQMFIEKVRPVCGEES